jgi:hypothetical protein
MLDEREALRDMKSNVVYNTPENHYAVQHVVLVDNNYHLRDSPAVLRLPALEDTLLGATSNQSSRATRRELVVNQTDALQTVSHDGTGSVGVDMTRRTCRYREDRNAGVCWHRLRDNQRNRVPLNIEHFGRLRAHLALNKAGQRICSEGINNRDITLTFAMPITKENP